jgi:hypothetical protein
MRTVIICSHPHLAPFGMFFFKVAQLSAAAAFIALAVIRDSCDGSSFIAEYGLRTCPREIFGNKRANGASHASR